MKTKWITNDEQEINLFLQYIYQYTHARSHIKDPKELYQLFGYVSIDGLFPEIERITRDELCRKHILFKMNRHLFVEYNPDIKILIIESDTNNIAEIKMPWHRFSSINDNKYIQLPNTSLLINSSDTINDNIFAE